MRKISGAILVAWWFWLGWVAGGWTAPKCGPVPREMAPEAARYLALMIVAGRGVVARHQSLINDPQRGFKGFTPAYVRKQMLNSFRDLTGRRLEDLPEEIQGLLEETLKAAEMVVHFHQERINQPGVGYKGFIPAVFGRQVGHILSFRCGLRLKQTTFKPRNNYNQPDALERKWLEIFAREVAQGRPPREGKGTFVDGYYRYLHPIYVRKPCLKCHGPPAGEKDLTGHIREGYREGDLRGAISVTLPVRP